jgi:hypothetical protein
MLTGSPAAVHSACQRGLEDVGRLPVGRCAQSALSHESGVNSA